MMKSAILGVAIVGMVAQVAGEVDCSSSEAVACTTEFYKRDCGSMSAAYHTECADFMDCPKDTDMCCNTDAGKKCTNDWYAADCPYGDSDWAACTANHAHCASAEGCPDTTNQYTNMVTIMDNRAAATIAAAAQAASAATAAATLATTLRAEIATITASNVALTTTANMYSKFYMDNHTCLDACGGESKSWGKCQCDNLCTKFDDCCPDFVATCMKDNSCTASGCGSAYNWQNKCQCDSECAANEDCCTDVDSCSCLDRCPRAGVAGAGWKADAACQCDDDCSLSKNDDCCMDKTAQCDQ